MDLTWFFRVCRPVSNLQYISKLTVKAVFSQTHEHMVVNEIYPDPDLKVMNNVLLKMNSQHETLIVLLDLSAAFNTVAHNILLKRLHRFGHQ